MSGDDGNRRPDGKRCDWKRRGWAALLALLLTACATKAPVVPEALPAEAALDPAPFALIFGRHPATQNGGGALPTAETAVAQAIRLARAAGPDGLPPQDAQDLRPLLVARGQQELADVQDLSQALDLVEASLEAGPGQTGWQGDWYRGVSQIVTGLRFDIAVTDRVLEQLADPRLPDDERRTASAELQARLAALMLGQDLNGDGRVDPRADVAGLLQLRDALGYAAVVDGEDWNCRSQPEPIQTVLAAYRQEVLWCEMPRAAEDVPQS
ncbi:hypothetical protein [Geminicoccus flavidas]|uniref:hypothetical protein n=1 Tax=Geminicoccus flavidas TaxID=2506407 RepID=UPI00135CD42F|nr:hypothetical protein [Geminicoccus flavidas]